MTPQEVREFGRVREDLVREAGRYHGVKLSIVMLSPDRLTGRAFQQPNHTVMLWQYMGRITSASDLPSLEPTAFGLPASELTAFGVVEGDETQLFCRMAARGGSLLPDSTLTDLVGDLQMTFTDPDAPGKPVFVANRDPIARWIAFVVASTWRHEPGRLRGRDFLVDPFAASLLAVDHLLDDTRRSSAAATTPFANRRFAVALSFPGEKRDYVERVATGLQPHVPVFYDKFSEAELARPNLDVLLQDVYHNRSELIVVFLCQDYENKEWCGLEWRAIRDLLKQRADHRIMFLRFDDATVSGVFSIDGYVDLRGKTPDAAVALILGRLRDVRASTLGQTNAP